MSRPDPAEVVFNVFACKDYFEWGIKIKCLSGKQQKEAFVGTKKEPLKMIGGWQNVQRYHADFLNDTQLIAIGPQPAMIRPRLSAPLYPKSVIEVCR